MWFDGDQMRMPDDEPGRTKILTGREATHPHMIHSRDADEKSRDIESHHARLFSAEFNRCTRTVRWKAYIGADRDWHEAPLNVFTPELADISFRNDLEAWVDSIKA